MDKIDQLFENEISKATHAYPSIYTKEDVASLLAKLQVNIMGLIIESKLNESTEPPAIQAAVPANKFAEFTSKVREKLYNYLDRTEIVDLNSAEFEISYDNKIELTRVDVDLDSWTEEFDMYMLDIFTEVFGDDSIIEQ
jgi:hypothetical protein